MPLLVAPQPGDALGQGDLLRGTPLHQSGADMALARKPDPDYVLVLSRNCNALRDGQVMVAPVFTARLQFSAADKDDFKKIQAELAVLRDGGHSPDRLYLGNIEGPTRFAAHLDEIYMLRIPEASTDRAAFLRERRVARLDRDQLYDLHSRLFLCFSRQGFDDHKWFANADLELIVQRGTAQVVEIEADLARKRANLALAEADPPKTPGRDAKLAGMRKEIAKEEEKLERLKSSLAPLGTEAESRKQSPA